MSAEDKGKEGGEGKTCRCPNLSGRVAFVLFTEAHVTVPVALRHAAVVHHEEVDLQLLGAGPPDVVVLRPYEVNHLHTATLARSGRRHRALKLSLQFY